MGYFDQEFCVLDSRDLAALGGDDCTPFLDVGYELKRRICKHIWEIAMVWSNPGVDPAAIVLVITSLSIDAPLEVNRPGLAAHCGDDVSCSSPRCS
jgi:hypothetical protein